MSETIIKSEFRDFHDMIVAKAAGCVVLAKSVDGHPAAPMIAIPLEDIPALIKALQPFAKEVHERESI
jgi:hypothetical protein